MKNHKMDQDQNISESGEKNLGEPESCRMLPLGETAYLMEPTQRDRADFVAQTRKSQSPTSGCDLITVCTRKTGGALDPI